MRVVVKSAVWNDLRGIGLAIAKANPSAAERFCTSAEATFATIGRYPDIGRLRTFSLPGIRSVRIAGFKSYLVFYLPRRDEVQVLAVLHGARDLPTVMEERL